MIGTKPAKRGRGRPRKHPEAGRDPSINTPAELAAACPPKIKPRRTKAKAKRFTRPARNSTVRNARRIPGEENERQYSDGIDELDEFAFMDALLNAEDQAYMRGVLDALATQPEHDHECIDNQKTKVEVKAEYQAAEVIKLENTPPEVGEWRLLNVKIEQGEIKLPISVLPDEVNGHDVPSKVLDALGECDMSARSGGTQEVERPADEMIWKLDAIHDCNVNLGATRVYDTDKEMDGLNLLAGSTAEAEPQTNDLVLQDLDAVRDDNVVLNATHFYDADEEDLIGNLVQYQVWHEALQGELPAQASEVTTLGRIRGFMINLIWGRQ
ncbi:uncharacterized protein LY89DRAFT_669706 [Mollisia scopiformis]|uniref:Uncharacterized protein n=1 Tax=Mollisia scopiformis TaxID=149040 RepID=A0A194X7T7_MOLSC|nr:uncharacterized protein LY89DRAFT_669706 [Mollisia scopiformis]KUJ16164.1 hypothetical protein LY89DRAFT_669706 [Mollisia scopiformis]